MRYERLITEMLSVLPEVKARYDNDVLSGRIDTDDGPHIVFNEVFMPLLYQAIDDKSIVLLRSLFSFVEQMEKSNDSLVSEVAEFTVLEGLCDNYNNNEFYNYLGDETKKALDQIRMYLPETVEQPANNGVLFNHAVPAERRDND